MIVEQQIEIAKRILALGAGVQQVFHSVELVRDPQRGIVGPAYRLPGGQEYRYVGLEDAQGFTAYIRYNGDAAATPQKVGGCASYATLVYPLRVVVFNDYESRDHGVLTHWLSQLSYLPNVSLTRVLVDKFALVRAESDQVKPSFDASVYYAAFDLLVNSISLPSCAAELCGAFDNPLKCTP